MARRVHRISLALKQQSTRELQVRKETVHLTCDICATSNEVHTHRIAYDELVYEIELCSVHYARIIADVQALGRFQGKSKSIEVNRQKRRDAKHRRTTAEIREWAIKTGRTDQTGGRLPTQIIVDYEAAHN
jgi:Lsr2